MATPAAHCDVCGIKKPLKYSDYDGWANVYVTSGANRDFCKKCWSAVERLLTREFVQDLLAPFLKKKKFLEVYGEPI